jgi:hypothetical protein
LSEYEVTWVTDQLAVGHAPMSYDDLELIRRQNLDAIVNLCAEFCDLHLIEKEYGFEVFYLPVEDDRAPKVEELEKALKWLDEAMFLGKRVLIHCRYGIGRTGTFLTSYLLRRGFDLRAAERKLSDIRSNPTSFSQWRFLRKYRKKTGILTIREPSLERGRQVDLGIYFAGYEVLCKALDDRLLSWQVKAAEGTAQSETSPVCHGMPVYLQFIEAVYLRHQFNKRFSNEERRSAAQRALCSVQPSAIIRVSQGLEAGFPLLSNETQLPFDAAEGEYPCCPFNVDGDCIIQGFRPAVCRMIAFKMSESLICESGSVEQGIHPEDAKRELSELSRSVFFALSGTFLEKRSFILPISDVVTGKFIEDYFSLVVRTSRERRILGQGT